MRWRWMLNNVRLVQHSVTVRFERRGQVLTTFTGLERLVVHSLSLFRISLTSLAT
jgi:hypothetical protein